MMRFGMCGVLAALALSLVVSVVEGGQLPHEASGEKSASRSAIPPSGADDSASSLVKFRDLGSQVGLTTVPHSTTERRYIVETMGGGGIALFDCDNDGKLDIAVVNDSTIDRYLAGGDPMITLYRQDGGQGSLHFSDVTNAAGLTTRGWGMGIAVGDFNNDGLPDLYVTGFGHNVLYKNLGGCRFEDVTDKAGVKAGGFSTGAAWADYNRDGKLDLFVARYVHADLANLPPPDPRATGYRSVILQMPDEMEGETDFLFRNRGDGTFEDVSQKAGVGDPQKLHGMGVVWGDYDNDGWPDLFVTNDSGPNYLYHNKGNGTFEEDGILSGTALGPHGERFGNMAGDFGDYNRDGKLDLVTSRYSRQPLSLYRNEGVDFRDVASAVKLAQPTIPPVKWGVGFGDFDNDGWPDIVVASGNFSSLMDKLENEIKFREPIQFFRNLQGQSFEEISNSAGLNAGQLQSRRGTAFGDINNDGSLDMVVFNVNAPPSLFINETRNANHSVLFHLVGTKSNRMAIGARVVVTTTSMAQMDDVRGGSSYNSTNDSRLHFGLGPATVMAKVEVRWPSGISQTFKNVAADALYEITEAQGIRKITSFPHASK